MVGVLGLAGRFGCFLVFFDLLLSSSEAEFSSSSLAQRSSSLAGVMVVPGFETSLSMGVSRIMGRSWRRDSFMTL